MWTTSRPDWQPRIKSGASLLPDLPLNNSEADAALEIFSMLRLPDVIGQPELRDAAGQWQRDLVRAVFGSYDPCTNIRGVREFFVMVPKKSGKALALDTLVATPNGFTTIGEIQVGDSVIGADGKPARVVLKSPVFHGRDCFEVEFSTGERVVCDADHLWVTDSHRDRWNTLTEAKKLGRSSLSCPTAKTTREIADTLTTPSGSLLINNHRTELCGALDLPDAELPLSPYALGLWLGDGNSANPRITTGINDAESLVGLLRSHGEAAHICHYPSGSPTVVTIVLSSGPGERSDFGKALKKLGLLNNKHIPVAFLRGSIAQRLALLQGLMDSDGEVNSKASSCIYSTTSPRLRDDVRELVNSLGFKSAISEKIARVGGKDCGLCWSVRFTAFSDIPVASLPRKANRQQTKPTEETRIRSSRRQIVAVRPVASVPTQCISVTSRTRQFLVSRSLIPTHNTTVAAAMMLVAVLLNRRPRAEFMLIAPTLEVADLAFRQAVGMIESDPVLMGKFHIRDHIKSIIYRPTKAFLKVKSFDPRVVVGSKPCGVLVDELHAISSAHDADRVMGQLRGGLVANPEAFLISITTQSEREPAGVFKDALHNARKVRDGELSLPLLPMIYEFPPDVDWRDTANWRMVNPTPTVSVERLIPDYEAAVGAGDHELRRWASQHLNVEIGLGLRTDRWAGAEFWEQQTDRSLTLKQLLDRSEVVVCGMDGGGADDLFGFAVLGRDADGRDKASKSWLLWSHAWCHRSVLHRRKLIAQRLLDFEKRGELTICDEELEDLSQMQTIITDIKERGLLAHVAVDPAGIGAIVDAMAAIGVTEENKILWPTFQGYRLMNAIKTCERRLITRTLWHSDNALMNWCVGNLKIEPTATAIRATKMHAGDAKIDPVMALFDAADVLSTNPEPIRIPEFDVVFA